MERKWAPPPLPALGSLRRLWLCKGLKSAKFLADKVQNLHNIRSPWGLAVMATLPTGPSCLLSLQSPPLTGGLVVSLPAGSEQGRGEKTLFSVGLGTGSPGCEFYGILALTGHGRPVDLAQSLVMTVMASEGPGRWYVFFKDFIYLFLERKEGRENINVWLTLAFPQLGTWSATQS